MAEGNYHLTDVYFCFGDWKGPKKLLGYLKNEEVFNFLDELESFVPSDGRCMQYYWYFTLSLNPRKIRSEMKPQRSLYIINKRPDYMKCLCGAKCVKDINNREDLTNCAQQCFRNIETGACCDHDTIMAFAKRFFEKKYIKYGK